MFDFSLQLLQLCYSAVVCATLVNYRHLYRPVASKILHIYMPTYIAYVGIKRPVNYFNLKLMQYVELSVRIYQMSRYV